jgi:hypothetical protein
MLARYAGSTLGLLAFAIVLIAGLLAGNPLTTTLSRGVFALFAFFLLGSVLGAAAQLVVNEHRVQAFEQVERAHRRDDESKRESEAASVKAARERSPAVV